MGRRFFRHGELHLAILALLADDALHGYELMGELGRRFGPDYHPSPGSVYPAVKVLAQEGLLARASHGGRVRYRTTSTGHQALADRRDQLLHLEERTGVRLSPSDELERSLGRLVDRVRGLSSRADTRRAALVLDRATDQIADLDPHPMKG